MVKLARTIFDFVSRYKHVESPPTPGMSIDEMRKAGYLLSDKQWLDVCSKCLSKYALIKHALFCSEFYF